MNFRSNQSRVTPLDSKVSSAWNFRQKLLAVAISQSIVSNALAADLTVTSLLDDNGAGCTLREAIISANADTNQNNGCVIGAGADTISFDSSIVPGTIILTGGEMLIDSGLTLQGPGADQLTIDADARSRHFNISDGVPLTRSIIVIDGLTLTNGNADIPGRSISSPPIGGAILNVEDLTLTNSVLSGNSASMGGGIYNLGPITVTNSTLSSNTATRGGGMVHGSNTGTLTNNTLSNNRSMEFGGGFLNYIQGTVTLINNTLTENSATLFGAGFYNLFGAQATLINNIIANNTLIALAAGDPDCHDGILPRDNPIGGSNNLIESGCPLPDTITSDPALGRLEDNGGPTQTHAILSGSPAIDMGSQTDCDSASIITDQTGMSRAIDGDADGTVSCDIGAFEFVDVFSPSADLVEAENVDVAGGTRYAIRIEYLDDDAPINESSLDAGDLTINSAIGSLAFSSIQTTNGVTTYTFTPPGGSWDSDDNGEYFIELNADQVFDSALPTPNAAQPGTLGQFAVAVPEIEVLGQGLSIANGDTSPQSADNTNFGNIIAGQTITRSFSIINSGAGILNITDLVSTTNNGFRVNSQPIDLELSVAEMTSFELSFSASTPGQFISTVTIPNTDSDENPYTFHVIANTLPRTDFLFANGFE